MVVNMKEELILTRVHTYVADHTSELVHELAPAKEKKALPDKLNLLINIFSMMNYRSV